MRQNVPNNVSIYDGEKNIQVPYGKHELIKDLFLHTHINIMNGKYELIKNLFIHINIYIYIYQYIYKYISFSWDKIFKQWIFLAFVLKLKRV